MFVITARLLLAQKKFIALAAILFAAFAPAIAQQGGVTMVAPAAKEPLADMLAGVKATGEINRYTPETLSVLVADLSDMFREYRVTAARSRAYGATRVEVFEAGDQFAAFGLLTYHNVGADPKAKLPAIGTEVAQLADALVFYKGNYFVRVADADGKKADPSVRIRMAQAVAQSLPSASESSELPSLFDDLAAVGGVAQGAGYLPVDKSERYILGPLALSEFIDRGRDMFIFPGEAEAVAIDYVRTSSSQPAGAIKLIVVEYHTPHFATDAMRHVESFLESLPESERSRFAVRREGNYVVAAVTAGDRELAWQMVEAVKYPYSVKWLRNPLLPTNDPFRQQKAAEMLISTFGILGLILGAVAFGGAVFGTTVFLRRRRFQREAFSDAGGMLRLGIDPIETAILGLPAKTSEK
jgi:hypothetical protein